MDIREYDPKSTLHVPEHIVTKAKFPFVDVHHHPRVQNAADVDQLIKDMDGINMRVLVNLKRLYVRMRSFPQARFIADLLLAVDPSALTELRDRGLLAYHMEDFASALRDLEAYLRLMPRPDLPAPEHASGGQSEEASESSQIWEHVKTLRRRVAGFN